ncbi:MAG TPA: glycosyltransferase family 39 protein [Chloroflexota bacterium]|nr:glycosyltransferase family 39 protein [Chloroflexota bacterium]
MLLLGWAVGLVVFPAGELGLDGHLAAGLALLPTDRMLAFLARDVHPPLYYLALKGWLALVGPGLAVARWPSLAGGLLALALAYRLGRGLTGRRGALAGALLLALTPAHAVASATARDTALGLALSVATLVGWRAVEGASGRAAWLRLAGLGLLTGLALATWYLHAAVLAVQLLDLVAHRAPRRGARAAALALGVATNLPWLVVALPGLAAKATGGATFGGTPSAPAALGTVAADVVGALAAPTLWPSAVGGLAWCLLVVVGLARAQRAGGEAARWGRLAGAGLLCAGAATYVLASGWTEPVLLGRYALAALPWAALAHGWALAPPACREATGDAGRARVIAAGAAALVVVLPNLVWGAHAVPAAGEEPAVALVAGAARPGEAAVFADHARFGRFALGAGSAVPAASVHLAPPAFLREELEVVAPAGLDPLLRGHDRVWLAHDRDLGGAPLAALERRVAEGRFPVRREERGRGLALLFERAAAPPRRPGGWVFGGAAELAAWGAGFAERPDGPLLVELSWRVVRPLGENYTVFAHLIDAHGQRVGQHDGEPELGLSPTGGWEMGQTVVDRFAVPAPPQADAGPYHLQVGLYRGDRRLPVVPGQDVVVLGPIPP